MAEPSTVITIERTSWEEVARQNGVDITPESKEALALDSPEGIHIWHIGMLSSELGRDDFIDIANSFSQDPLSFSVSGTQRIRMTPLASETMVSAPVSFAATASGMGEIQALESGAVRIEVTDVASAYVKQITDETCWAASVEAYGEATQAPFAIDQIEIADRFNLNGGEGNRDGDLFKILLAFQELQNKNSQWSGKFAGSAGAVLMLGPPLREVVESLARGVPLVAGLPGSGASAGHIVLIVGGEFAQYRNESGDLVWRAHSIMTLDPQFPQGSVPLSQHEMTLGLDFFLNAEIADKALNSLYRVHTKQDLSLEEQGFTLLDTTMSFFQGW